MKALLVVVFAIVACSPSSIAGFEVGERRCETGLPDLGAGDTNACYGYKTVAEANLEQDAPSHAPVVGTEIYVDPVPVTLGGWGTRAIVVLRLADEAVHAYRVQCGVGIARDTCIAVDRTTKAYPAAP
jgi:hypothetical protein